MCFGVRDALRTTHQLADNKQLTILGQLVHNPVVDRQLAQAGVRSGSLDDSTSSTQDVVITAQFNELQASAQLYSITLHAHDLCHRDDDGTVVQWDDGHSSVARNFRSTNRPRVRVPSASILISSPGWSGATS